jgi:hypothetical protein
VEVINAFITMFWELLTKDPVRGPKMFLSTLGFLFVVIFFLFVLGADLW